MTQRAAPLLLAACVHDDVGVACVRFPFEAGEPLLAVVEVTEGAWRDPACWIEVEDGDLVLRTRAVRVAGPGPFRRGGQVIRRQSLTCFSPPLEAGPWTVRFGDWPPLVGEVPAFDDARCFDGRTLPDEPGPDDTGLGAPGSTAE